MSVITSRVPAAITGLLEVLAAEATVGGPLDKVFISDGPPFGGMIRPEAIYIGYQPEAEQAVSLAQAFASAGARRRDEDFEIACYAEVLGGGTDMAARRTRVFELVAVVETVLRGTDAAPEAPTLNGSVLWSHLTTGDLWQNQTDGAAAGLGFTIACRARI